MRPEKPALKDRLYLTAGLFGVAILLSWSAFYLQATYSFIRTNEGYIAQASSRVIDTMESTFLSLEHVAMSLSTSGDVKSFLRERDPLRYHEKSRAVTEHLESIYQPQELAEDILIYNMEGVFRRFRGELGNTAAAGIFHQITPQALPQQLVGQLEGANYVGYVTGVYEGDVQLGYLAFLLKNQRLRSLFSQYDASGDLLIGLVSDGCVMSASDDAFLGRTVAEIQNAMPSILLRKVGVTPFEILVAGNGEALRQSRRTFALVALGTGLMLLGVLFFLFLSLDRMFFRPTLSLIENAHQMAEGESGQRLQFTGVEDFDRLVEQVNAMLYNLEEKNRALYEMRLDVQEAQIESQRATIVSLKKQISAHFTVNTLNVIKRLDETGEHQKVREMCDGLANLLRYANNADETIGGMQEMEVLQRYVDIMQIRYPNRFEVVFEVDDRLDEVLLPRMLLQPLVENAILHGLCPGNKRGTLCINARVQGDVVTIQIVDNGGGMSEDKLRQLRELLRTAPQRPWDQEGLSQIALPNIQKRVVSDFGEGFGLTLESEKGVGTIATLRLPSFL